MRLVEPRSRRLTKPLPAVALLSSPIPAYHNVGDLKWSARTDSDQDGWLLCDGRTLHKKDYPRLFAAIGNTYGGDDGGETFRLPDPRDRVLGVSGHTNTTGVAAGSETHVLTIAELPAHTHTGNTNQAGTHNHGGTTSSAGNAAQSTMVSTATGGAMVSGSGTHDHMITNDGNHTHSFTTAPSGSGQPHNIMQPTLFIGSLYIFTSD